MNFLHCLFLLFNLISSIRSFDYSLTIDEKSSIEQPIFHFPLSYELINNFQSNFHLTNNQQDLVLTKIIDRDLWCSQSICSCEICSLTLQLFSNENKFSTINITINDINDHSPQFLDIQRNISLSESIQIGHRFPIARAIDYDSGENGRLTFDLLQRGDYFQLDIVTLSSNEYALYGVVQRTLDREILEEYPLVIKVHDHGTPQNRSNQMNITIEILDENDNAPKFDQTEYSISSLKENTPIGTVLLTVHANDADQGLNGFIHYSIINSANGSSFPFSIDSLTGVIRLRSALDYEKTRSYRFLIRASDSGPTKSLFTDTWLSISIDDVNDCPIDILFIPNRRFHLDNQTLLIEENLPINNLTLGYIRLSDQDSIPTPMSLSLENLQSSQQQDYQLTLSNQPNTYVLSVLQGTFDRESQPKIHLRLIAFDTLLTSNYDLTIHLIDQNDNPSVFPSNPMRFSIEEVAGYQMVKNTLDDHDIFLGYLNATDPDEGDNARNIYQLEDHPLVKIDSKTGRIHLTQPLDREEISRIVLKGKAINVATPKWSTDVEIIIDVLDVNDQIPRCLSHDQRVLLPESFPIDQPLLKINATDPDEGVNGTIRYAFQTNSTWPFEINRETGEIFSKKPFDYESEFKEFSLTIDLEDRGNPIQLEKSNACQIQIFIEDVNDNRPELIDDEQREIFLNYHSVVENFIIPLNITDADSEMNGKLKFSLQSIDSTMHYDSNQSLFQILSNGSLQIVDQINEIALFQLKIFVEDSGYPSQQNLISISIAFGDDSNPVYSSYGKIVSFFEEQRSHTNHFAFVFGLTILIVTFICCISMVIICLLMRQHRQRHQAAMIARKKLMCLSSQQLTTSDSSTVTSNTTTLSIDRQQILHAPYWNPRSSIDQHSLVPSSTPESDTYKILHIPIDQSDFEKDRSDNSSSDHGYHGSYQTRSPSSASTEQISNRRDLLVNQLPYFVTRCKSLSEGFIIEMNVDGSDEDAR